jgi:Bacterial archaeo-eukaryotic release factor family 3
MDTVSRETLLRLSAVAGWPAVSIYLPTHRRATETEPDRIRLRNLVSQAREALVAGGLRDAEADSLLADASALSTSEELWGGGFDGLAVFVTKQATEVMRLDTPMPERAVVGDRLYLRPLFAAHHADVHFWALALDKNGVRLLKGDHTSIDEVPLPAGTPVKLADETQYDVHDEALRFQTIPGVGPTAGRGVAQFHGHGGEKDVDKVSLQQFLIEVDSGVTTVIGAQCTDPLVVLGVDYVVDTFREVASYSGIVPEHVNGATGHLSPIEIHDRALKALASRSSRTADTDLAELADKTGTGATSSDPAEVLAAAASGRVKTLFMDDGAGPWGTFDRATMSASAVCDGQPAYLRDTAAPEGVDEAKCGWDLVDLAAVETITRGGTVHAFTGEDAPVKGVAAVFRY